MAGNRKKITRVHRRVADRSKSGRCFCSDGGGGSGDGACGCCRWFDSGKWPWVSDKGDARCQPPGQLELAIAAAPVGIEGKSRLSEIFRREVRCYSVWDRPLPLVNRANNKAAAVFRSPQWKILYTKLQNSAISPLD